ncbi:MAG TPA: AMP-binding protein [Jatrophihabitans sp.]|jgi:acyl-coenzyme A synthetase/AMP-(fatty) acid ligase|uniref:class I adenylate-forming enzyme family protein n=1 Tax=Jatrophihabitans sp. TaxID=1932789 RepID=UPI002EF87920
MSRDGALGVEAVRSRLGVGGLVEAIAGSAGGVSGPGGVAWTGGELVAAASELEWELRRQGVRPGAIVGWAGAAAHRGLAAELACLMLGAVAAPMPPDALEKPPLLLDHRLDLATGAVQAALERPTSAGDQQDDAPLVGAKFTSGTTGPRKAVGVPAAHLEHTWAGLDSIFGIGGDDVVLAPLEPHVWLQRTLLLLALARGAQVVLAADPRRLGSALRSTRPTVVFAVPSVLAAVAEAAQRTGRPLAEVWGGRLRSLGTGSAPSPASLIESYRQAGIDLHEGYGTSETGMIAKNGPGRCRLGTVGPAFPGVRLDLVDGIVRVRCSALPAPRYLDGSPIGGRESADTHLTRDLGRWDPDGYLTLLGRADDVITLPSGRKVHPQLVEEQVREVPGVADCAVFADERHRLRAAVVPTPGTPAELVYAALREHGSAAADDTWPAPVVLAADAHLPRNSQGKLVRHELIRLSEQGWR